MLDWRIYYGDGSMFDSTMGSPAEAPPLDVQVINERTEKEGVVRLSAKDYYWHDARLGQWCAGDQFGLFDWLLTGGGGVKFGRSMRTPDFDALFRRAVADPDFPRKAMRNYAREGPPRLPDVEPV